MARFSLRRRRTRAETPAHAFSASSPEPDAPVAEPTRVEPPVPLATPEPAFVHRMPPPAPERPLPAGRRAIFFDVENTSRPEHIARLIEHLGVDRMAARTEFIAVGNWRVIGSDTARLLAKHGAQLVHSAPAAGVRDWSDLRIAVSAGVWLASARPGDILEIVTDDRAFDAVGDVAAALGIAFRRLSFRRLIGAPEPASITEEAPEPVHRARERGRGRGRVHEAATHRAPVHHREASDHAAAAHEGAHTAPHDEIVQVVRELIEKNAGQPIVIDTLANALKSRGFSRPPGSPRLITRLRRIRELDVSPRGMIALVNGTGTGSALDAASASSAAATDAAAGGRRRRRSRRGGRRHRRRGTTPSSESAPA
jgi:hypothetical protein